VSFRARIEGATELIAEAARGRYGNDKPPPPSLFLLGDHARYVHRAFKRFSVGAYNYSETAI